MRKSTLAEYGFRLPSCIDNRPLKFEEWERMRPQTVFVSATPGPWELERTGGVFAEQVIRPTGLIDPVCIIRPTEKPGRRPDRRVQGRGGQGPARAGHHADQAHGRGPDRIPARGRHPRALHPFRRRDPGAHRDHPRPAARRVRRAGRHQPAARGARHPGMRAGRASSTPTRKAILRSQDLAGPDHRPRRAQHRRPRDPLCRHHDRVAATTRSTRPTAGARSSRPTTPPTASPRNWCATRSATSCSRSTSGTT